MAARKLPKKTTSAAFPYESRTVDVDGHAIHYVEEGRGDPILFVHGNPTSSYVFRNVLGPVARATGRRAIALDLLGMGRSAKPRIAYSCALHASIIEGFIDALRLRDVILVAEDWGGPLAMDVLTREPTRFRSAILMETFLWPMTYAEDFEPAIRLPFKMMRTPVGDLFSRGMNIMINKIIPEHCPISDEALDHYRGEKPTWADKKAMADFPRLIPVDRKPPESQAFFEALGQRLPRAELPILWILADPGVVVSNVNPIGMARLDHLREVWPHMVVRDFGPGYHFLSEEDPERVCAMVSQWVSELDRRMDDRAEAT